jgi:integration host factor subunit beta|nr:HU family DNA-binding protein [Sphingomonas sp. CCH9-F2]
MIRSELVAALTRDTRNLSTDTVERIVSCLFEAITDRLAEGGRVELRGFGTFSTRARDGRTGRNPRTGDAVAVGAKRVPHFKASKTLHARLNGFDEPGSPTPAPRSQANNEFEQEPL